MHKITVTKVDHDSWWGYYIEDDLYGYNDYYNFSDEEVKLEAILRAIDDGIIKNRKEAEVVLTHHTDLDWYNAAYDDHCTYVGEHIPGSLAELKQRHETYVPGADEDEDE